MIAIVPIRSGSKGINDKNIKQICGKPLVWWILNSLQKSKITNIIVATDENYVSIVESFNFEKVTVYSRKKENSTDTSTTESLLIEVIKKFKINGKIMLLQATSPLTKFEDINTAIKKSKNYDSLLSVVKQKRFIWDKFGKSLNYDFEKRPRRQDWDGYFVENGAIYVSNSLDILKNNNRLNGKIGYLVMNDATYFEIDNHDDWMVVESLLKYQITNKN